ncbi:hypothetical protein HMPREF1624_07420 [Sporothrix schenckii ATCC 58251]|uniref:Calcineurin-like phosphoesterase domain-containing protein n=1 Tax=Sporothrix schenckii (strain ATCC 58251 / de Perez 2211183) TaxID=1391915 RepID=U7PP51_SPOS1|nr:hypothetical protein HMPREF1624_07420 [Sporothrix schenckii ATCC 58251]
MASPGAMALQIVSDLHLEIHDDYDAYTITPHAPVLALLGDIGLVARHRDALAAFLARHLRQFEAILFVPGNHEAYHSSWPRTRQILQQFEDEVTARRDAGDRGLGDLVVMDRQAYRLPPPGPGPGHHKVVVLGCSLFSHVPPLGARPVQDGMNDFRLTAGWDVAAHNAAHQRDRQWLNEAVTSIERHGDPDLRIVIVSHWSPTGDARARDPRHGAARDDALASAFATDLLDDPCFRSPRVCAWAFGHTHYNCDFLVARDTIGAPPIRLLANQRGYAGAGAPKFDPAKVLLIE